MLISVAISFCFWSAILIVTFSKRCIFLVNCSIHVLCTDFDHIVFLIKIRSVIANTYFLHIQIFKIILFIFGCATSQKCLCCHEHFALVGVSRGYSALQHAVFSFQWLLLLPSVGSRAHGLQWLWHVDAVVPAPQLWTIGQ